MRLLAVAALAALSLSACQDPAGVGLGLIDEDQADPSVRVVPLSGIDTLVTGTPALGIADPNSPRSQPRVLVGAVTDAAFGDARAVAYVDALQPAEALAIPADEVLGVWLDVPRSYTYGDQAATLPVDLRQVQGSWSTVATYPVDTLFAVGSVLTSATVAQADTLTRFTLPDAWVRANAATLVSPTFGDDFEGFALQAGSGFSAAPGVVFGFDTFLSGGAALRLRTADDTVSFALSEVFTSIATARPVAPPAAAFPFRRNSRADVRFTADLASVGSVPLARGVLRLPADTSFARQGSFVRPLADNAALFGVRSTGGVRERISLGALTRVGDEYVVTDARLLTTTLQRVFLSPQTLAFERYEVRPTPALDLSPASLDIFPVVRPVAGTARAPRFTLTVVGAPA